MNNNTKTILKATPSGVIALLLMLSGSSKISGQSPMAAHFQQMHLGNYVPILGCMEIAFALCFILPRTIKTGLLLLTAYFGGAMAVELPYGTYALVPCVLLTLIWVAAYLRRKDIFLSSAGTKQSFFSLQ